MKYGDTLRQRSIPEWGHCRCTLIPYPGIPVVLRAGGRAEGMERPFGGGIGRFGDADIEIREERLANGSIVYAE